MFFSWLRSAMTGSTTRKPRTPRAQRRFRPTFEQLEDRLVPTTYFVPQLGLPTETSPLGNHQASLQSEKVVLIFAGSYWQSAQGQNNEQILVNDAGTIAASPYLSGLVQYGSDGKASVSGYAANSQPLAVGGAYGPDYPTPQALVNYVRNELNAVPALIPAPSSNGRSAPVYFVIDDPADSGPDGGAGLNYWNGSTHLGYVGTSFLSDGQLNVDWATEVFSHELAEATVATIQISDPGHLGGGSQICDNEPGGSPGYAVRLNGVVVQAYFSVQDGAFIVPGSSTPTVLQPIWQNGQYTGSYHVVPAPAAPDPLTATVVSGTQISLAWNTVAGANNYIVDYWANGGWQPIGQFGSSANGCSVSRLTANTQYWFKVAAVNLAGTTWSAVTSVATSQPAAPVVTATGVSSTQVNLSWNAVSGASGYCIDWWTNGGWHRLANVSGVTSYLAGGLNPNTTYYFWVGATNALGTTWTAKDLSASTLPTQAVGPLTGRVASGTEIDLRWDVLPGEYWTNVYEKIGGTWQLQNTGGAMSGENWFECTGLTAGNTYSFMVTQQPRDQSGTTDSNIVTLTTQAVADPVCPWMVEAASGQWANTVTLYWSPSTTAVSRTEGYIVQEWINGAWQQIANVNAEDYTVPGLTAGQTYYFRVAAYNQYGTSDFTSAVSISVPNGTGDIQTSNATF